MRLGVVSDTHGHVDNTRVAVQMLESLCVDRVVHCGDVGSKEVVELFAPWRTDFVVGNCDHDPDRLAEVIAEAGQTCRGRFGELHLNEKRIALLHSDDRAKFLEVTENNQWDLVCYGHTHVAAINRHGRTLIVNPGALYRANPHSLAVVDLSELTASIIKL